MVSLSFTIVIVGVLDALLDVLVAVVDGAAAVAFFFLPKKFMVVMMCITGRVEKSDSVGHRLFGSGRGWRVQRVRVLKNMSGGPRNKSRVSCSRIDLFVKTFWS